MPPKKAAGTAAPKKAASGPSHPSYKDMIKEAILTLKERNGSSRPAIKKYILANNKSTASTPAVFDSQFNKALRTGVEKGDFTQPKGPSGTVKLAKKETAKPAASTEKKPAAAKKDGTTKAAAPKKRAAPKKAPTTKAAAEPKKASTTKKTAAPKPKANTASKRKTPTSAPAVVDQEKVIGKTKSGRITKGPPKPAPAKKAAATKKAATKKAATPKKKAAAAAAAPAAPAEATAE